MLQVILKLVILYLLWLSSFCFGFYYGSIRANNPMETAADIGSIIFIVGVVFSFLKLFSGDIASLLEAPATIQAIGIQPFLIVVTIGVLILFVSSAIPGYIIGYFIAKAS